MGLNVNIEVLIPHNKVCSKVGYPVPIWHRYLCNRCVLEPNQNADYGAIPERSVLCFSQSHIERELRQLHSLQWNVFFYSNGGSWSLSKVPGSSSKHMQRHRDAAEQTVCDALLKG